MNSDHGLWKKTKVFFSIYRITFRHFITICFLFLQITMVTKNAMHSVCKSMATSLILKTNKQMTHAIDSTTSTVSHICSLCEFANAKPINVLLLTVFVCSETSSQHLDLQLLEWLVHFHPPNVTWMLCFSCYSQMTSTATLFIIPGHGSPPKTSGDTVTEQRCSPRQFCNESSR